MRRLVINHFIGSFALGLLFFPIVTLLGYLLFFVFPCRSCGLEGLGMIIIMPVIISFPSFLISTLLIFIRRTSKEYQFPPFKKILLIFSPPVLAFFIAIIWLIGLMQITRFNTEAIMRASNLSRKNDQKELEIKHLSKVTVSDCNDYIRPILEGGFSHAEVYISCKIYNQNPGKFYISGGIKQISEGNRDRNWGLYDQAETTIDGIRAQYVKYFTLESGQHEVIFKIDNPYGNPPSYFDLRSLSLEAHGKLTSIKVASFDYITKKYDLNNYPYPNLPD